MERISMRVLLCAGLGITVAGVGLGTAQAQVSVPKMTIDGGPLGTLDLSGGVDGFFYGYSGAGTNNLFGNGKSIGAEPRVADIKVVKPTGPVQFTIEVKPDDSVYFGIHPSPMTASTFTLGPVYAAYVTLAPNPALSISVGQIYSLEGWESSTDWNNANLIDSSLYYVENSSSRGISATYTMGKLSATVNYGDGFDSGVFNVVQGLATYAFDANNALSLYGTVNFGRTGPSTYAYGNISTGGQTGYNTYSVDGKTSNSKGIPYTGSYLTAGTYQGYNTAYVNSNMIGSYYDYTNGNLNIIPEVQYVYSKVDHKIGLDKFTSNFGAEVIANYTFPKTPWSVGGMVNAFSNVGPQAWYLNAHSAGVAVGVTPTWQKGHFFVRGEAGLLHLTSIGSGSAFGSNGTSRNQVIGILGAGFVF